MGRPLRIQYPGAVYHVMARGSHGQAILADDKDGQQFLETPAETLSKHLSRPNGRDYRKSLPGWM